MFYTIGEVSKKYNLPLSTLRYYDNEGLIPNLEKMPREIVSLVKII